MRMLYYPQGKLCRVGADACGLVGARSATSADLPIRVVMSRLAEAVDFLVTAAFRAIRMVVVLLLLFGAAGVR